MKAADPTSEPPHSEKAERGLLACIILEGEDGKSDLLELCRSERIGEATFYDSSCGIVYASIERCHAAGQPIGTATISADLTAHGQFERVGGFPFLFAIEKEAPTTLFAKTHLLAVHTFAARRETIFAAAEAIERAHNPSENTREIVANLRAKLDSLEASPVTSQLLARLKARRFNHAIPPADPQPRFLINGRAVCTPGNLTNLIAQAKAGKTAFLAAMVSAVICAEHDTKDRDTLGVTATAPGTRRLLHFDTEQSPFDHDQLIRRALRRAGVAAMPAWLDSFGLAGFNAVELRSALSLSMKEAKALGGLFAVILDGTADFVNDVNDPEECNAFVAQLHGLAIEYDCPIINVVHENPGQDGGKMRGHLGSQLERKAESNLRLRKSEEITVVFSEKMRKAPILERDGPRFRWDDGQKDHVSCESAGTTKDEAKRESLRNQAEAAFISTGKPALRWNELRSAIEKTEGIGTSGAGKRFVAMRALGVLKKDAFGNWSLAP